MSEVICEDLAHRAGFILSVGNWIAPDGTLIAGENYDQHHWETIKQHLGINEDDTTNRLIIMNSKVEEGFLRLVFRADVLFQVDCTKVEDIWDDKPNHQTMVFILNKLRDIDIHVFSKGFYAIGKAQDIVDHCLNKLQIKNL